MKLSAWAFLTLALTCVPLQLQGKESRFTIWQLSEQSNGQMMSYVIRTPHGKIIVIDGGRANEVPYLKQFLAKLGNKVDAWFISHLHDDHMGAITEVLRNTGDLEIGPIYASTSGRWWMEKYFVPAEHQAVYDFEAALKTAGKSVTELVLGQQFDIGGVRIEILAVHNPEIHANQPNNSSVVMRVSDDAKSIIFLGDLGPEGGEKLLKSQYRTRLHADYVQMAHHGQNGVNRDVYEAIGAKYALWPTPRWLWDNNTGKGKGSGPWKTLEVRKWMEELGIRKNYVTMDGEVKIE